MKKGMVLLMAILLCGCSLVSQQPDGLATPTLLAVPMIERQAYVAQATPIVITPTPSVERLLNPPVNYPATLDEAWYLIDEGAYGFTFDPCEPGELTFPYVTWEMALQAVDAETPDRVHPYLSIMGEDISQIVAPGGAVFTKTGLVRVTETSVYVALGSEYLDGNIHVCGNQDLKPILHGVGVQNFLDWLAEQPLAPLP